jgi:hypothetical protein
VAINTARSKTDRFFDMYAARFGALTDKDGLDEWRRMVEPDGYDEQAMHEALETIAAKLADNPHSRKPRMPWVKMEYRKATERSPRNDPNDRSYCGSCRGSGYIIGIRLRRDRRYVDLYRIAGERQSAIDDQIKFNADLPEGNYVMIHACHCGKGAAMHAKTHKGDDDPPRHDAEALREVAKLCLPYNEDSLYIANHVSRWGAMP